MLVLLTFAVLSSLVLSVALIFISAHCLMSLTDVECDYLNPAACCSKLNRWVVVEVIIVAAMVATQFVITNYHILLINAPLLFWVLYRYFVKVPALLGIYDRGAMMDSAKLTFYIREAWAKLFVNVLTFVLLVYGLIVTLINGRTPLYYIDA